MGDNSAANNSELRASAAGAGTRVAILMTCHNRRETTLACLATLVRQRFFAPENLFLVDDGSRDGTGAAVQMLLPQAQVIPGDGSLFWNGGMRLAWDHAKRSETAFDFYLWLNDDVALNPDALEMLVDDADGTVPRGLAVIVAAATTAQIGPAITYGGHNRPAPSRRPLRMQLVHPAGRPVPVDTISGNIVLVSAAAEAKLGNLAAAFEHIYGDLDYGLRAGAKSVPVLLASRPGGTCAENSNIGTSLDFSLSRAERLALRRVEGRQVHARDWRRFVTLHGRGGALTSLLHRLSPYLRIVINRQHRQRANT